MWPMKRALLMVGLLIAAVAATGDGVAQTMIPPGGSQFNPPPPPPPPGPKITVPVVPKLDELPSRNYVAPARPSFSDKVTTCLEEGAAAGLGPTDRAAYSRACANTR
jgi:hypothetical protein